MLEVLSKIRESQSWRADAHAYHAELYFGGTASAGMRPGSRSNYEYQPSQMPFNVCRRTTDAMVARISRTRPQPIVQSTHGSWSDYKRAKKGTQLLEGEFHRQRFWPTVWPAWIRDACTFGSGFVSVYAHGRAILSDRVLPTELFVDEWDARYGDPRNLYRIRDMDRGVVAALFGRDKKGEELDKIKKIVEGAGRLESLLEYEDLSYTTVDRVTLIESWHLCDDITAHATTTPEEDRKKHKCSGRHAFTLTSGDLEVGDWKRPTFPIIKLDYTPPLVGYIGQGIVEQLEGTQYEINKIEDRLQEGFELVPTGWIFNPGGYVLDSHFVNGIGKVIDTPAGGMQPTWVNPEPVHPEMFQRQASLVDSSAADTGQTPQGMQGAKQPGVNAAVAMRELEEQESARHVVFARSAEEAALAYGRLVIECVKDIAEEFGDHAVAIPMNDGLLPMKWSECNVERYELRVFSSSLLPQSRPARVQTLSELLDRDIIDRETFLRQLEATDLQGETDLMTAGRILLDEVLETMLFSDDPDDPDAYIPPSQFINPEYAVKRTQQKILWAKLRKAPDANILLLERHIVDYEFLAAQAAARQAPPAAPVAVTPTPAPVGPPGAVMTAPPAPMPGPPPGPIPPPPMAA